MKLTIGEPVIIAQGMRPEENWWGAFQFPRPYIVDGNIYVSVETTKDDIYAKEITERWFESTDLGKTWREVPPKDKEKAGLKLPNGDIFSLPPGPAVSLEGYQIIDRFAITPDYDMTKKAPEGVIPAPQGMNFFDVGSIIQAYDIDRLPPSLSEKAWDAVRVPAGATKAVHEKVPVDWPYLTRVAVFNPGEKTGTMKSIQPRGNLKLDPEGNLYVTAFSGEGHLMPGTGEYAPYYSAELFKSTDNGHSFFQLAHMEYMADGRKYKYNSGGFSDNDIAFMKDGSIVWFMRSTWAATTGKEWDPMYMTRSEDGGKTWTDPEIFAPCGVLPRLATLGCGVTLLLYARPGMYLQACLDDSGKEWSEPLVLMKPEDRSHLANEPIETPSWHQWDGACGNPEIIPLTDTTALIVYGDFYVSDEKGVRRKSICCREVKVEL